MKRLESLDVLRGLDMFVLVAFHAVLVSLAEALHLGDGVLGQLEHVVWEGFAAHDIIMPLFMFCSGVAIPYAFSRYKDSAEPLPRGKAYLRIARRFVLLWILGMIYQGNLLSLEPEWIKWYSNTLQAIAVGYAFSAIIFLNFSRRDQVVIAVGLLLLYWALMSFVKVDGFGGNCNPVTNLCEWVDRVVLGKHCDHVTIADDGSWAFVDEESYTWVLSSLNFVVTVLAGVFAGTILKAPTSQKHKMSLLLGLGAFMIVSGLLWSLDMPIVKHIWTSSMTLFSSGICFLLLAVCYYVIDVRGWKKAGQWVLPFGMNSILAYMLPFFVSFTRIAKTVVGGLKQYMPAEWYGVALNLTACLIFYGVMYFLYRKKIFLKV